MEEIKIISSETFREFQKTVDNEISKIPPRYKRKKYYKEFSNMMHLIYDYQADTVQKLQPLTKYNVLVYDTINLGNNTYACYVKVYKVLNDLMIKGETPLFYRTNWGRIAKKKILAIIRD